MGTVARVFMHSLFVLVTARVVTACEDGDESVSPCHGRRGCSAGAAGSAGAGGGSAAAGTSAAGVAGVAGMSAAGAAGVSGSMGGTSAGGGTGPIGSVDSLTSLPSRDHYAALSGAGAEVKYLAIVDGVEPPAVFGGASCLFQNTAKYPYHLQFLRTFPEYSTLASERYADMVLRRTSRVAWGGGLKLSPATQHPVSGNLGVLAYVVYSESSPSELLTVQDVVEADQRLKDCIGFAADWLVFMPDGAAQAQAVEGMADELRAAGVAVIEPAALRSGLVAETYSEGEGYGYLKLLTQGAGLDGIGPRDVLVTETAPNDLGLVAGLVTENPQSQASHVNLRLREKGVPSASVPAISSNVALSALTGSLVRIIAEGTSVEIEPARLDEAEAFWRERQPEIGEPPLDLERDALTPFDDLRASDAGAFGSKASNLGELTRVLPPDSRVEGFAIPLRAYADFMGERGLAVEVEALLGEPLVRTDATYKARRLDALRDRVRSAALLPDFVQALEEAVLSSYGEAGLTTRLRFRSSTNAEDLPEVSGAGLYDSRSGCLADDLDGDSAGPSACLQPDQEAYLRDELMRRQAELAAHPERIYLTDIIEDLEEDLTEEKSAVHAIRRVWASLWNERAFDDREYYGIDHRRVFMGLAVHPAFVGEQLEAVALTNLEPRAAEPIYRIVSQAGEIGVARPADPSATPEILSFRRSEDSLPSALTLVQPSSLASGGESLWSEAGVGELASMLFQLQDHFATTVYEDIEDLALDIEVDVTRDGRIVAKQVRPYLSAQ